MKSRQKLAESSNILKTTFSQIVFSQLNIYLGRKTFKPSAIKVAPMRAATAPTTTRELQQQLGSEGLSPPQQRLLVLPYDRVASWLWNFLKEEGEVINSLL